jgi:hypothetical protein
MVRFGVCAINTETDEHLAADWWQCVFDGQRRVHLYSRRVCSWRPVRASQFGVPRTVTFISPCRHSARRHRRCGGPSLPRLSRTISWR